MVSLCDERCAMDGLEFFFEEAESGFVPRGDASEILGGGIAVVETVVASIHEARGRSGEAISSERIDGDGGDEQIRDAGDSEGIGDSNDVARLDKGVACVREDGDAEGVVVNNSKGSCWTRRIRIGKALEERDANPSRVPALEASMRAYADRKVGCVVNPALGTSFDSVEEAYEFYNLYSWQTGFGVRYAKSRLKSGHMMSGRWSALALERTDDEDAAMAVVFLSWVTLRSRAVSRINSWAWQRLDHQRSVQKRLPVMAHVGGVDSVPRI